MGTHRNARLSPEQRAARAAELAAAAAIDQAAEKFLTPAGIAIVAEVAAIAAILETLGKSISPDEAARSARTAAVAAIAELAGDLLIEAEEDPAQSAHADALSAAAAIAQTGEDSLSGAEIARLAKLAASSAIDQVTARSLSEAQSKLLHEHLFDLVCSWRWERDLYSMVNSGRVPYCDGHHDQDRAFFNRAIYPPGGRNTAMVKCSNCALPMPPNIFGSKGLCWECYQLLLAPGEWAKQPSAHRFEWTVSNKADRERFMQQGFQLFKSRGGSGRPIFRRDDPRVAGGRMDKDGKLHDPWRGTSGGDVIYKAGQEAEAVATVA